jgi:hypothetical protein
VLIALLGLVMGLATLEMARSAPFYLGAPFGFAALMTMIASVALTDKQLDRIGAFLRGKR